MTLTDRVIEAATAAAERYRRSNPTEASVESSWAVRAWEADWPRLVPVGPTGARFWEAWEVYVVTLANTVRRLAKLEARDAC